MQNDRELLTRYAENGSEAAFAEVVRRYVRLVYSVAQRLAGPEEKLAEDITQKVFIILARKAPQLIRHESLIGWLHTTTRHVAWSARRDREKRQTREKEALAMETNLPPSVPWERLRPLLDEAVGQLPDADRQALLLRYFQGMSHREVGEALGLQEDAARVRTDRAVEKLHQFYIRRGITTSGALLAEIIAANAMTTEPAGLAGAVTNSAMAANLTTGVLLKMLYMTTQTKIVLATAAVALVATVSVVLGSRQNQATQEQVATIAKNSGVSPTQPKPLAPAVAMAPVVEAPVAAPAKGSGVQATLPEVTAAPVSVVSANMQNALETAKKLQTSFNDIYAALIDKNDPDAAMTGIEAVEPQLIEFRAQLAGTPVAGPINQAIDALATAKDALQHGDIPKAKASLEQINQAGPQLGKMLKQAAGKPVPAN